MSNEATRRAWVEVDASALARNGRSLTAHLRPGSQLLPMIKADGYGLGASLALHALAPLEPWGFGVATAEEAVALRREKWGGRVIAFTPCPPLDAEVLVRNGAEVAVAELAALETFGRAAGRTSRRLGVHLEVETGMGRGGLPWQETQRWAGEVRRAVERLPLRLAGVFTHFHSADVDAGATRVQWERFGRALADLRSAGVEPGLTHACNSAAAVAFPEMHADLVRPGIFLYGGGVPGAGKAGAPSPEPVAAVRARVLSVRDAEAGTTVSYGATYRLPAPGRLATLGIGYGDGLRRAISNRGAALVRGRRAPIRGTVCMDATVVEVTGIDGVRTGDVATLLGRDGEEEIGLDEMAESCGTIAYEVLTGLSTRLPRVEAVP